MKPSFLPLMVAAALIVSHSAAANAISYEPGFVWDREADWVAGPTHGNSAGNPSVDAQKALVYSYEFVTGGTGLNDPTAADRWYAKPGAKMVWRGFGTASWIRSTDNVATSTNPTQLVHAYQTDRHADTPVVRWLNPVPDQTIHVSVGGDITLSLTSDGAPANDYDVVVGWVDASTGEITLLYSATVNRPGFNTGTTTFNLTMPATSVALDPGDAIFWSARARTSYGSDQRLLMADDITITIIPAPTAGAMVGVGCGAMASRRRRQV